MGRDKRQLETINRRFNKFTVDSMWFSSLVILLMVLGISYLLCSKSVYEYVEVPVMISNLSNEGVDFVCTKEQTGKMGLVEDGDKVLWYTSDSDDRYDAYVSLNDGQEKEQFQVKISDKKAYSKVLNILENGQEDIYVKLPIDQIKLWKRVLQYMNIGCEN